MAALPLAGITVVAVEQAVAAPFATRQLADLGARVIKIERRGSSDFCRAYDTTVNGLTSHFVWLNRTKESVTLDLKQPRGGRRARPTARPCRRVRPERVRREAVRVRRPPPTLAW
jgi:crotonobetainyl-CoA:carnitine CoA-transferase CaiB-like acyl-CoA transferase